MLDILIVDTALPDLIAMHACHWTYLTQYATQGLKHQVLY